MRESCTRCGVSTHETEVCPAKTLTYSPDAETAAPLRLAPPAKARPMGEYLALGQPTPAPAPARPVVVKAPVGDRRATCPDGGACHHSCALSREVTIPQQSSACWRVRNAGPLSGMFEGDRWPRAVKAKHGIVVGDVEATLDERLAEQGFRSFERSNVRDVVREWLGDIAGRQHGLDEARRELGAS